ncbi:TMAO reductase system periplasmic protein TorT [Vibrio maerlii]|uniref:TMAO reductase system periplasmic protein TorT n=1 Tax=Vibrio maerlii TaxID=2231648 RepID=UPI000E3E8B56|nr:TMAO reductase system periplasmic protein TorT [Vibrio maerlii]
MRLFLTLLSLLGTAFATHAIEVKSKNKASETKPRICAIYPHLKDSYWLSVNYGMVDEAKKLGAELRVLESGGYPNIDKQRQQLSLCVNWQADAIILGTVSPDAYMGNLEDIIGNTPVFATVNALDISEDQESLLKGSVGVDWYWMGYYTGQYLNRAHSKDSKETRVALLPGPNSSGGTKPVIKGFYDAIQDSNVIISSTHWEDNDKELQRNLIQQIIDKEDVDYIVGSAVAIEAAISELRSANKTGEIGLISTYLSHGVYRGLIRDRVEFAPTDQMVEQGRLSIQQVMHWYNQEPYQNKLSPDIVPLTQHNLTDEVIKNSLSPSEFRPVFHVE